MHHLFRRAMAAPAALTMLLSGCGVLGGPYLPSQRVARVASMADAKGLSQPVEAAVLLTAEQQASLPPHSLAWYAGHTIADSPLIREVYYGLNGAQASVEGAQAARGPQLAGDAHWGVTDSAGNEPIRQDHVLGVDGNLVLLDGGQGMLKETRARWVAVAALATVHQRVEAVAYAVAESYISVVKARSGLHLAEVHVARTMEMLTEVRSLATAGTLDPGDIPEAEARVERMREAVVQARQAVGDAEAKFRRLTGERPVSPLPRPSDIAVEGQADDLAAKAETVHPAVKILDAEIQAGVRAVMAIDAERFGSISLNLGTSGLVQAFGGANALALGAAVLKLSLPLVDSGDRESRIRGAAADLEVSMSRREDSGRQVALSVRQAWNARQAAVEQAAIAAREQKDYARVFQAKHVDYRAGLSDLRSALDAEQGMMEAESKADLAKWDRTLAGYGLLAAMGELASHLGAVTHRPVDIAAGEQPFPMPSLLGAEKKPGCQAILLPLPCFSLPHF